MYGPGIIYVSVMHPDINKIERYNLQGMFEIKEKCRELNKNKSLNTLEV